MLARRPPRHPWALLLVLHLPLGCVSRDDPNTSAPGEPGETVAPLELPPREPGPPRAETREHVTREEQEANALLGALGAAVSRGQLASMADIRGYRHYHARRYRRAQVWFEHAVRLAPSYELSLYNAARVAALLGELERARTHLAALGALRTPMAARALERARQDPDLAALRRSR